MDITRSEAIWQIQKTVEEFGSFLQEMNIQNNYTHYSPDLISLLSKTDEYIHSAEVIKKDKVLHTLNNEGLQEFYSLMQELSNSFSDYYSFSNVHTTTVNVIDDKTECHHIDGAIIVADYIVNEIKINCRSEIAKSISYCINYEDRIVEWNELDTLQKIIVPVPKPMFYEGVLLWVNQVAPNRPWDHKPLIKDRFGSYGVERPLSSGTPSKSYYHKYRAHDYYYDVWSNIHYGYVGMYCGFTEDQLLDGAGLAQYLSDSTNYLFGKSNHLPRSNMNSTGMRRFDAKADRITVRLGISLFALFGKRFDGLTGEILLNELEKLPGIDESRLLHYCYDYSSLKRTQD